MTQLTMVIGETRIAMLTFKAADGSSSVVEQGSVAWGSSNPEVVLVTPDPINELQATIEALTEGEAVISAGGDGDLSAGVRMVNTTQSVAVYASIRASLLPQAMKMARQ